MTTMSPLICWCQARITCFASLVLGIMPFSICVRVKTDSTPGYSRRNACAAAGGSLKALHIGLDAGGRLLVRCWTGEQKRGHLQLPSLYQAGAQLVSQPPAPGA